MVDQFLCDQIASVEAQIVAYNTAISTIVASGGVTQYRLDTGQTVQTVTRANLNEIQDQLNTLYNLRQMLRVQCGLESGTVVAEPGF